MEIVESPAIFSYHDFEGMSHLEVLRSMLEETFEAGAEIAKLAVTPTTLQDGPDLLGLLLETKGPTC
jgi:3-dehydroquinate dehydratase-1